MPASDDVRNKANAIIESERDRLVELQRQIVRIPSPNPPGDTRDLVDFLAAHLREWGIEHTIVAPNPEWPNLVATVKGRAPGKRLVLNDHLDHFPAEEASRWTYPPYAGEIHDGKIYGRGVATTRTASAACCTNSACSTA